MGITISKQKYQGKIFYRVKNNNKLRNILCSNNCQKAFEIMKHLVIRDVLLSYPQFNIPFEVYL